MHALPGLLYLATQGIALLVLWLMTSLNKRPFDLHAWDGDWYLAIAKGGYAGVPASMTDAAGHHTADTAMAFFPAYPTLVHLADPMEGGSALATALTISVLAGIATAFGVGRLAGKITDSRRAALIAVILVAAAPMSIIFSMTYAESMLTALTTWALVGLVEKRWTLAGWCAGFAGLTRPTAVTLIAVVMIATIVAAVRTRGHDRFKAVSATVVAPAGLVGYLFWVGAVSGSVMTYFNVQSAGWNTRWDWGVHTAEWFWHTLTVDTYAYTVLTVLLVIGAIALLVASTRKVPPLVWLYAAGSLVVIVCESGIDFNKVRLLLPISMVLCIPAAARLAGMPRVKTVLTLGMLALGGIWFSAYSLSAWHYGL